MARPGSPTATQITFVRPSATLPVSLTGETCALNCAHCGGHYLKHMATLAAIAPDSERKSLLISGGCDPSGRVPVSDVQLPQLQRLHETHRLNWHVGLVERADIERVADLIDLISFDIVGDPQAVREVYGLDLTLDDYVRTLGLLQEYATVVPHITIGLRGGQPSGEFDAIDALREAGAQALVLIILIPTKGTRYAECDPPDTAYVRQVMEHARRSLPDSPISLGCMRPHGGYRRDVDIMAMEIGLDVIVNPSYAAQTWAKEQGLYVTWADECCAFHLVSPCHPERPARHPEQGEGSGFLNRLDASAGSA